MTLLLLVLSATAPDTLWSNVTSGGVYSSLEMDDIDGDGTADVVSGVNFWDSEPTLWALSGSDGSVIWTSSLCQGIYQDEGMMVVPDLDGDSYRDVVLATPGGYDPPGRCVLLVSGLDGSTVWTWSAYSSLPGGTGWGYSCDLAGDVTGDGYPEILAGFGTTGSQNTGAAVCLDGISGDAVWTVSTADATEDILSVPDITGDDLPEVCVGIGGNSYTDMTVRMLDGATGSDLWSREGGGDVMCLSLVDRSETLPWIVDCTFDGEVRCHSLGGDSIWAILSPGMLLDVEGGPDLDGDGTGEVALAADNGGTVCLDGATGAVVWSYPTGSNTWSIAWADSVLTSGTAVPCIAGGAVNGRRITLVDALTGQLVWDETFSERVYNVSVCSPLGAFPSPTVLAGLQDQTSLPYHAWAFASSLETGLPEGGVHQGAVPSAANPSRGSIIVSVPDGSAWQVAVFDLTGRLVTRGTAAPGAVFSTGKLQPGCYFVRTDSGQLSALQRVVVLP